MTGTQYRPHIGRAFDGRFVASWVSPNIDGSSYGIAARRFDASGSPVGADFLANSYTTGFQLFADVAVDLNGDFVVVWDDASTIATAPGAAVFGQRFDASGNRLGGEFQVNSYTTGPQRFPSISVSPAGGFVVAWSSPDGSGYGMSARRFDASGTAAGSDFVVNTYTTGVQNGVFGQVAHDAHGNFVVTWSGAGRRQRDRALRPALRRYGRPPRRRVPGEHLHHGHQALPSVACDAVGNFVVAWNSSLQDGSDYGIFAQRFGGLRARRARRRHHRQPGAGAGRDGGRAAHLAERQRRRPDIRRRARRHHRAPGRRCTPSPTASASYGTVPNGASAPCTRLLRRLGVQSDHAPGACTGTRRRWRRIVPDTQGQQKQWLLHIGGSFTDVPVSSGFYRFIETLLHHSVTGGCTPAQYCPAELDHPRPDGGVRPRREGRNGLRPARLHTPVFTDVPASSPFCRWIEELARRAVVSGCGGGNYCPTEPRSRASRWRSSSCARWTRR